MYFPNTGCFIKTFFPFIIKFPNPLECQKISKDFDYHLHSFFVDAVLLNYLSSFNKVFEFGCGTGYHLFRLNDYFPNHVLPMDPWLGFELIDKIYSPIKDFKNIELIEI